MTTTRRAAAAGAAGGLALGLIGGYIAGGLYVLRDLRRMIRRAGQDQRRAWDVEDHSGALERTVRDKDAEIARLRTARPPLILDEYGSLGTIPGLADRLPRPLGVSTLDLTALVGNPARAYNPLPVIADTHGDAPAARLNR